MHLVVTSRERSLLTVCFIKVIMKFKLPCVHLEGASDAELESVWNIRTSFLRNRISIEKQRKRSRQNRPVRME